MTRTKRLTLAAVGLGAMASFASAGTFEFMAIINGDQENPPSGSPATGTLSGIYDDVANTFTFSYSITDELIGDPSAPGAHIHDAPAGSNGGIVFGFYGGAWPLSDTDIVWSGLTPAQVDDLFAGGLYANYHTTAFPGGEVRGQIELVPSPAALPLLAIGGLAAIRRRR